MTNCLKVDKRQKWVDCLFEQSCITSSNKYNAKKLKKIKRRLPKKIKRTKKVDLQTAIATIITNPNETWKNLKRENTWYRNHTSKTITKPKSIRPNRLQLNSYVEPYRSLQGEHLHFLAPVEITQEQVSHHLPLHAKSDRNSAPRGACLSIGRLAPLGPIIVIGHGIGGIVILAKVARLAKARRWSKR